MGMREAHGRQEKEQGEANDVQRVEEPEQHQQSFRGEGRIPPVAQEAEGRSASASELAFGESEKKKPQQGNLRGSWGWDDAAALGAGLLGGPIGLVGALAYESHKHSQPEAQAQGAQTTGPAAEDKKSEPTADKPPPPTMSHTCITENGDIPNQDRMTVGVGEDLVFTGSAAGKWSADNGAFGAKDGAKATWRAPSRAGKSNITLDVGGQTVTRTIEVVAPASITYEKQDEMTFPKGVQGAGMNLNMHLEAPAGKPVSFKNVLVRENPGPASNPWGYFAREGLKLDHKPTDGWTGMDDYNWSTHPDEAGFDHWDKLPSTNHWAEGGMTWMVPHYYTIKGEEGSTNLFGKPVPQTMTIHDKDGTSSVTKDKASSKRRKP
jgi:hypothetical protein